MPIPTATYRLQFRNGMTFSDAVGSVPYLKSLGISHLYASPIFTATSGSTHGYDIVDPNNVDPAIGGREGFDQLVAALKSSGLQLILDIVPNHMAASLENRWWDSVLQFGKSSPYASFFDIDWTRRITLPVLDRPFEEAVASGLIGLARHQATGEPRLTYYDQFYPLDPQSVAEIERLAGDEQSPGKLSTDASLLNALHQRQHWQLIDWKGAAEKLSYRRFFEVTGLVGVRVEDQEVFDRTHRLVIDLVRSGSVQGLRIDHVDGLADPADYLAKLRAAVGEETYILVEKIVARDENLPANWPVAGTTGYEVIASLGPLFIDRDGLETLDTAYRAIAPAQAAFAAVLNKAKQMMVRQNFTGERARLCELASAVLPDVPRETLDRAITDILVAFQVYRTYGTTGSLEGNDRDLLETVLGRASAASDVSDVINSIGRILLAPRVGAATELRRRMQQLTGPVIAKAMEDTAFYRYNRLLALNEVGCDPDITGDSRHDFHEAMRNRARTQPQGLTTTATHDTKRGEDARARLYGLTEHAEQWVAGFERWQRINRQFVSGSADQPWPDTNTQWMLYQALAGAWPEFPDTIDEGFRDRFKAYAEKAVREAKTHTDWGQPNKHYEAAVLNLAEGLLSDENTTFRADFQNLMTLLITAGHLNSLSQTLIKLTIPGVPDIYQGAEQADLSLVDPDNRRPVDFQRLRTDLQTQPSGNRSPWQRKQAMIATISALRQDRAELFSRGSYQPLAVSGPRRDNLIAFARQDGTQFSITLAPRLLSRHVDPKTLKTTSDFWADTSLELPLTIAGRRRDLFGDAGIVDGPTIDLDALFRNQPYALLISVD
ncbi:malto-oligosyltrehalose synthase (plasmid) [Rhizobium grahamii]|uniref:Malto-oligosyltrehalose synthase n=1 Tax=Rhizobium grahamii TaxID=1120045 RepID=A0A5Q0CC70_9HYPH|nr:MULTISPECIES: malto-oligosyltrehalose synthase [Rhizobium]QFY63436.1 malto-oligosyltrehalose synthase [Rhizobium grahamii]QRM51799.1 malto-oligosyltrehalose synthase [Rhizobium sp. BG6]